jgi:hypothetical protein
MGTLADAPLARQDLLVDKFCKHFFLLEKSVPPREERPISWRIARTLGDKKPAVSERQRVENGSDVIARFCLCPLANQP